MIKIAKKSYSKKECDVPQKKGISQNVDEDGEQMSIGSNQQVYMTFHSIKGTLKDVDVKNLIHFVPDF